MRRIACLALGLMLMLTQAEAEKVDTLQVHSDRMNRNIEVVVVSPQKNKKNRTERYPVVYLLHGAGDNARSWVSHKKDLPEMADSLHLIFVTPNAEQSWYIDSPKMADSQFETFTAVELVNYIDSHYPTQARRERRAITGLSMGGHGALYLAMRHKDVFGACGSMSGGVDFRPFPQNWNLPRVLGEMASNKQAWDDNVVVSQLSRIQNGDLAITFCCGESDFFLEVNKDLHKRLLGRGIDHDFLTAPGAHNWTFWCDKLDYQLLFFRKYFAK